LENNVYAQSDYAVPLVSMILMVEDQIAAFMALSPQRFTRILKYDCWWRHPIDEIESRLDIELWLCDPLRYDHEREILKLKCFNVQPTPPILNVAAPLCLRVRDGRAQQWEHFIYEFINEAIHHQHWHWGCLRFEATITQA
jgi:hypothetical protein